MNDVTTNAISQRTCSGLLAWHFRAVPICLVISVGFCAAMAVNLGMSLDALFLTLGAALAAYLVQLVFKLCSACAVALAAFHTLLLTGRHSK